ncbi:MAG: YlmC/YmxH family sporulation protein [Oscillospiraceae bacterium]
MLFSELRDKEVVSIKTGVRLGLIDDLEFDEKTATIKRLYIYGRGELFGFGNRSDDVVIQWEDIDTVGGDIILVKNDLEYQLHPRKRGIFGP